MMTRRAAASATARVCMQADSGTLLAAMPAWTQTQSETMSDGPNRDVAMRDVAMNDETNMDGANMDGRMLAPRDAARRAATAGVRDCDPPLTVWQ